MDSSDSGNLSSPYDLAEKGLLKQAAEAIDRLKETPVGLRVLRAQLYSYIGSTSKARREAEALLRLDLPLRQKADCLTVLGRAALKSGETQLGLRIMAQALESAIATKEPGIEVRVRAKYANALLHWVGVDAACVEMRTLRRLCLQAGNLPSMATYYLLAAEINARRGQPLIALTHLDVARGLLERFEDEFLRGRIENIYGAASIMLSDFETALKHIQEAQSAAMKSGARETWIAATGNFAIVKSIQGEFSKARALSEELLREVRLEGHPLNELNLLANIVEMSIADHDIGYAQRIDDEAAIILSKTQGAPLYVLHYSLTKVRLLYAQGEISKGVDLALRTLPAIQKASETDLLLRIKLIAAEGLSRLGRPLEGTALLREVVKEQPFCSIEMLAETCRTAGLLAATEAPVVGRRHLFQAERILIGIGSLNGLAGVRSAIQDSLADSETECTSTQNLPANASGLQDLDRIVTLLQLRANPKLVGLELLALSQTSMQFEAAAILEIDRDGRRTAVESYRDNVEGQVAEDLSQECIPLGSLGHRSYELLLQPRRTVAAEFAILSIQRLAQMAASLTKARQIEREFMTVWPAESSEQQLGLIFSSDRMKELMSSIRQIAGSNVNVLITGETGVGKELFAKAIHTSSPRSSQTFLPFNCSTVPRDLIDSQLFGHKRGAFTGAQSDSQGMIRSAAGGTLFLDEIGDMAIETQPKLLRFLESGEIFPLGESKPLHVDVRIVAATNANLDQLVAEGRFREDLFYRLNVVRINVPPLRERREEIPALVEHFLQRFGAELKKPMLRIADETLEYLVLYGWPGNVRQLANEVRRLVAMAEPGSVIMPAHLSDDIGESRRTLPANRSPRLFNEVVTRIDQPLSAAVEHVERAAIQRALSMTDGRLDEAAKLLGLSRKGLYLKRQRLNLG